MKLWRTPFDQADKAAGPCTVLIDEERCKGCGYCVEFCPRGVLEMGKTPSARGHMLPMVVDEGRCLGCGLCQALCPEFAIRLELGDKEE